MSIVTIKDLGITEELNSKAMAAVRGGFYGGYKMPSFVAQHPSSSNTTVSVKQANSQYQSNPTGNGSVTFGGDISAENNQQGFNLLGGSPAPVREMLSF
jgi:hypothetical protein